MAGMSDRRYPKRRATAPARPARRAVATLVVAAVALASTACVGRLGRNDDDVTPESDHPKANQSVRIEPVGAPFRSMP
jgi:hypothetical protein